MAAGNQLAEDGADLHGRSLVVLLLQDLEVARVNPAALLEKVAYRDRPLVIDHAIGPVDQLVAKLGNEGLDRDFVYRAIGRNAGNYIAEGNHFSQLRMNAGNAAMPTPEQVNGMANEGIGIVDRNRAATYHTDTYILERRAQVFNRRFLGNYISADQHHNRTDGLLKEQVDGRSFSLALFLNE